MTIGGGWWLIIILGFIAVLFGIAKLRGEKPTPTAAVPTTSTDLVKLNKLINRHLPTFSTTLRHNRIIVQNNNKKRLMLTIDDKVTEGSRQLGDAVVVNFHKLPTVAALKQTIQTRLESGH